jgi:hypothetical protein
VDDVGEQERVVAGREVVGEDVPGADVDPGVGAQSPFGDGGDLGQLEHRRGEGGIGLREGERPRTGAAADVQHPAPGRQSRHAGKRAAGSGGGGVDAGRHHRHQLVVDVEDLVGGLAASECSGQVGPRRVAELVPELQQRPEVRGRRPGQERGGDRCVRVPVTVPFQQAERDHGVGADACRAPGETGAGGEAREVGRSFAECFEESQLVGGEEVLAGHEPLGELEDPVRGHGVGCRGHGFSLRSPPPPPPSQNAGRSPLVEPRFLGVWQRGRERSLRPWHLACGPRSRASTRAG